MIRYVLLILTMLSLLFSSENKKLAQTGFQFLSISSDARSGGMADAMTTIHSNSVALFFNPAGLSRQNQFFDINFAERFRHAAVSRTETQTKACLGAIWEASKGPEEPS